MDARKIDIYGPCDRAIQTMNREAVREFGRMKGAKWDELNVIREVREAYDRMAKKARRHYFEVATEAYILGALLAGVSNAQAHRKADDAIFTDWLDGILDDPDPVTGYRFTTETKRKAERLAEAILAAGAATAGGTGLGRNATIEKATRDWSRMAGQYAINMTDYAMVQAYQDAGVDTVMWITKEDERVCEECGPLHGKVFRIDEAPPKLHWGCRCRLIPVPGKPEKA